jgi:hypothetical protein
LQLCSGPEAEIAQLKRSTRPYKYFTPVSGMSAYAPVGMAPTRRPGPTEGKLGAMAPAVTRFAFRLLVLLVCVIASWRGAEQRPSREVVELVSVVYKPARMEAAAAAEPSNAHTAAPLAQASADSGAPPKRPVQGPAPAAVQQAKAVPRREPTAAHSARPSMAVPKVVKVSCRPAACHAAPAATRTAKKRPGARQEPPLPAVFVPVRTLGLYLQARLGAPREGKAATAKGKGQG